jgi:acyl-CoA synthetase (AMP-forming)/AMP-acid ligase II
LDDPTTPNTIGDVIRHWAENKPDAPAFISEKKAPLSYQRLAETIENFRGALNASGFGRGDRIAIVHPGGAELAIMLLSVLSGATAIPLNPNYTAAEFVTQFKTRRADCVIISSETDSPARKAALELALPVLDLAIAENACTGQINLRTELTGIPHGPGAAEPHDVALVMATSGTTSGGKIVPLRQQRTVRNATTMVKLYELTPRDRCLFLRPLYYSGAINNLMATCLSGGSVAFLPEFDSTKFFRDLVTLEPTWFAASPTFFYAILAGAPANRENISRARLRFVSANSARLDSQTANQFEELFGVPVQVSYSSTEAGKIAGNPQPPGVCKPGTVGPVCGPETRIMDESGNLLSPGCPGEVMVRGEQVFEGYENDPAANEAAFTNGWFHTGDEGFFDEDGYLVLTGRIKEMINRGGEKVSPLEVDSALLEHPKIADAASFAIPHPTLGEIVGAAVIPVNGEKPTDQELTRFLADRLALFKIPSAFLVVEEIPRGPTGKILRKKLSEQFSASC